MFVVVVQSLSLFAALWPHGLEHTRLPHPSLSPGVCSNSCLLSKWCHPTISSSVAPFASCPQSFPLSGSFPKSWLFEAKKKKTRKYPLISWHRGWSLSSFGRLGASQGLSTWTWGLTIQLRHETRTASNNRPFQSCTTTSSAVWTSLGWLAGARTSVSRLEA